MKSTTSQQQAAAAAVATGAKAALISSKPESTQHMATSTSPIIQNSGSSPDRNKRYLSSKQIDQSPGNDQNFGSQVVVGATKTATAKEVAAQKPVLRTVELQLTSKDVGRVQESSTINSKTGSKAVQNLPKKSLKRSIDLVQPSKRDSSPLDVQNKILKGAVLERHDRDSTQLQSTPQLVNVPVSEDTAQQTQANNHVSLTFGSAVQAFQLYQLKLNGLDEKKKEQYGYILIDSEGKQIPAQLILGQHQKSSLTIEQSQKLMHHQNESRTIEPTPHNTGELLVMENDRETSEDRKQSSEDDYIVATAPLKDSPPTASQGASAMADLYCDSVREGADQDPMNISADFKGKHAIDNDYIQAIPSQQNGNKTMREDQLAIAHLKRAAKTNPLHFQQLVYQVWNETEQDLTSDERYSLARISIRVAEEVKTENRRIELLQPCGDKQNALFHEPCYRTSQHSEYGRTQSGENYARLLQNSLAPSQSSAVSRRGVDRQSNESSVKVNLKSLLTAKQSGNHSEKGIRSGQEYSRNQSQLPTSSKGGNNTEEQLSPLQVNFDQSVLSASPSMRKPFGYSPSMNTSTKKLAEMRVGRFKQLQTEKEKPLIQLKKVSKAVSSHRDVSNRRSNASDGTPVFKLPLDPKTLKLRQPPSESPGFPPQPSASSSYKFNKATKSSFHVSREQSASVKNSSHFRITPGCGGSASSNNGRGERLQGTGSGTSPKLSSQQTFGAKNYFAYGRATTQIGQRMNHSQGKVSQRYQNSNPALNEHSPEEFSQAISNFVSQRHPSKLLVLAQQSSQEWNAPQTSPMRASIDDTMKNIARNKKASRVVKSPDVASFQNNVKSVHIEINKENGENQQINSELSSSLVTSYNSDDREDQLRVREVRHKHRGESPTKRSMTSPSSLKDAERAKNMCQQTRVREALHKKYHNTHSKRSDLKRLHSSHGERQLLKSPTILMENNCANSNINSSQQLTENGSKKTFAFKADLERKHTSLLASPNNISDKDASETHLRLSQQSRSNSRSSNLRTQQNEREGTGEIPRQRSETSGRNLSVTPQPPSPSHVIFLQPGKIPEFETIRDRSQSGSQHSQQVAQNERPSQADQQSASVAGSSGHPAQSETQRELTQRASVSLATGAAEGSSNPEELIPNEAKSSSTSINNAISKMSNVDEQTAFEEAQRNFKLYAAQNRQGAQSEPQRHEPPQLPSEYGSHHEIFALVKKPLSPTSEITDKQRELTPPQPHNKSILASVPENLEEEDNQAAEQTSRDDSKSSFDFFKAKSGKDTRNAQKHRALYKIRAQKSMIMLQSPQSQLVDSFMPLRHQLTAKSNNLGENQRSHQQHLVKAKSNGRISQQVYFQHKQQARSSKRKLTRVGSSATDLQKMRLMQSPSGSFAMPGQGRSRGDAMMPESQIRSQSSSRKSSKHMRASQDDMKRRHQQISDTVIQIESIFSSLMTPVNRRSKCQCGNGSKCDLHSSNLNGQNSDFTPKSDKNFSSYLKAQQALSQQRCNVNQVLSENATNSNNGGDSSANTRTPKADLTLHSSNPIQVPVSSEPTVEYADVEKVEVVPLQKPVASTTDIKSVVSDEVSKSSSQIRKQIDEFSDYQDKLLFSMQGSCTNDQMLQPGLTSMRKTCKTIRELSIEDAMSSAGNLSANISQQITPICNPGFQTKKGGFIKELKRRRSSEQRKINRIEPQIKGLIKQGTEMQLFNQSQSPVAKSPKQVQSGKIELNVTEDGQCRLQHRQTFAATQKYHSQVSWTETAKSIDSPPQGSQTYEQTPLKEDETPRVTFKNPTHIADIKPKQVNRSDRNLLSPVLLKVANNRRSKTTKFSDFDDSPILFVQPANKGTQELLGRGNNELDVIEEYRFQSKKWDLKPPMEMSSRSPIINQSPKTVNFEPIQTPVRNQELDEDSLHKIELKTQPQKREAEKLLKNLDQSTAEQLRLKSQQSELFEKQPMSPELIKGYHQQRRKRQIKQAGSINEMGSSCEGIFHRMSKENSTSKGSRRENSLAETAHFHQSACAASSNNNQADSPKEAGKVQPNPSKQMPESSKLIKMRQSSNLKCAPINEMNKRQSEKVGVPEKLEQEQSSDSELLREDGDLTFHEQPKTSKAADPSEPAEAKAAEQPAARKKRQRKGLLQKFKQKTKTSKDQVIQKQPNLVIKGENIKFVEEINLSATAPTQVLSSSLNTAMNKSQSQQPSKSIPRQSSQKIRIEVSEINQLDRKKTMTEKKHTEMDDQQLKLPTSRQTSPSMGQHLIAINRPSQSESPVKAKLVLKQTNIVAANGKQNRTDSRLKNMRLIKKVQQVYRASSAAPAAQDSGFNYLEFFDLSRKKKIIDHLQESKLINDQIAHKLESENKMRYDEALKKAEIETKRCSNLRRFQSPEHYQGYDNSTPSVNRSSLKLNLGANGFQDLSYAYMDICEMTPSHFNLIERDSQFSTQTYGNSSVAIPLSEFFNADLYEEEKIIDSYDQSPMGISQSQMSDFQFKFSSKGGNSKDKTRQAIKISSSISDLDMLNVNANNDLSAQPQKTHFQSIVQQQSNSSIINRDQQSTTPITDCRGNKNDNLNSLGDNFNQYGLHLLRPDKNYLRDADRVSHTTFSRSDLNFQEPSRRHSTSESGDDTSHLQEPIKSINSRRSSLSKVSQQYQTAEPQQHPRQDDFQSHRQEQLLKTAEKRDRKQSVSIQVASKRNQNIDMKQSTISQFQATATPVAKKQSIGFTFQPGNHLQVIPRTPQNKESAGTPLYQSSSSQALQVPARRPTQISHQKVQQIQDTNSSSDNFALNPGLIQIYGKQQTELLEKVVDKKFNNNSNKLDLLEKPFQPDTTARSCVTGRRGKTAAEISSRIKTEGNASQFERESVSDNLYMLNENQLAGFGHASSGGESFRSSSIQAKQRMHQMSIKKDRSIFASRQQTRSGLLGAHGHSEDDQSMSHSGGGQKQRYSMQTSTPTNLNSKRRIKPNQFTRMQTSEVKSNISRIRHTSITTTSCVSTKVCGKERINQYQIMMKVGSGSFSEVFACFDVNDRKVYAMKVMNKTRLRRKTITMKSSAFDNVKTEMAIMKKLDHPYICKLYEIIDDPTQHKLYLIIEHMKQGSIERKIEKVYKQERKKRGKSTNPIEGQEGSQHHGLPEETMRRYFSQLILALEYCHTELGIIHRDIKPDNLLIDANDNIKLSDFGVSQLLPEDGNDKIRSNAGSNYFYSPEACIGTMYKGRLNDIWACGITLFYMATGNYPFVSSEHTKLYRLIQTTEPEYPKEMLNTSLHDLIVKLLKKQPEDRITIDQIKQHPWITVDGTQPLQDVDVDQFTAPTETELEKTFTTSVKREKFIYHRKVQDAASAFN